MEIPSNASQSKAVLGQGYNIEQERFSGQCVQGETIFIGAQEAFASFDRSLSASSLSKSLGFEVGGKARYGAISGSASAKFLSQASENSYSEVTVYSAKISFKNAKLDSPSVELTDNVGRTVKRDGQSFVWEDWETVCGHEFVDQITLGAALYICARIEFSTREAKQEFKAELNIKGPAFQVSGKLKTASSKFSGKASIVISAYQLGGDVARLNTIFDATTNVDGKEVNPLLVCSFDNPEPCLEIFNKMLQYATDADDPNAFPQQLNGGDFDVTSPSGPAQLVYLTAPWSDLAFLPPPPLIADLVQNSRKELSRLFEENYEMQNRVNNLKTLNIRLSPRQSQNVDEVENQVVSNLNQIIDAANICYSNPEQCPISVNNLKTNLNDIDRSKLDIFPETFSQWYAIKDLPSTLKSTRDLIDGIVAKFKDDFVDFDSIEEKGLELERFLMTLEELDLSFPLPNQQPSLRQLDFRPIAKLSNLKKLSITSQQIRDLNFVKNLTNLEVLELAINQIEDLSPLAGLTKLKILILNRNDIENLEPISDLTKLEELELLTNDIRDLTPLSNLKELSKLLMASNNLDLTSLSALQDLTNLRFLFMPKCQINDITFLRNLVNLDDLWLDGNRITELKPLENLINLRVLGLNENQIEDVSPLSKLTSLKILRLSGNKVKDITALNQLDTSDLIKLVGNPLTLKSGSNIQIKTRLDFSFICPGGKGNVESEQGAISESFDTSFVIQKFNGEDGDVIKNGDFITLKTQQGFFFNSLGSTDNVSAIEIANNNPEVSDEIFTIVRLEGDGEIKNGDRIMLKTRLGFFFNCLGSQGNVSAVESASDDPSVSDEIFTINIVG